MIIPPFIFIFREIGRGKEGEREGGSEGEIVRERERERERERKRASDNNVGSVKQKTKICRSKGVFRK